jgi:hypothetical protein
MKVSERLLVWIDIHIFPLDIMNFFAYVCLSLHVAKEFKMFNQREVTELRRHLEQALAILNAQSGNKSASGERSKRNPDYFRPTGHLSDAGIEAIYELFDNGATIEEVADTMGISVRGAAGRRRAYLKQLKTN